MKTVPEILDDMKNTFEHRGSLYKDNFTRIGYVLEALFPEGITIKTPDEHNRWHLYLMMLVKITRLACTDITHRDSAHDCAVYSTMLESIMDES